MENPTSILLYSKYSQNCKIISNLINSSPVPLPFKFLCTDNKDIRQRIADSKKIDVNYLPCILNVYSNGTVEQYEGPKAFEVVQNILSSIPPPIPEANEIYHRKDTIKKNKPEEQPIIPKQRTVKQRTVKRRPPPTQRPKQVQSERGTLIEDLPEVSDSGSEAEEEAEEEAEDDEQSNEEEEQSIEHIRKPRIRIRMNKGNFEEHDGEDYSPPEHSMTGHRHVRNSTDRNIKDDQSNISMKAQELAKQREQSDNNFKPRGAGIPPELRRE